MVTKALSIKSILNECKELASTINRQIDYITDADTSYIQSTQNIDNERLQQKHGGKERLEQLAINSAEQRSTIAADLRDSIDALRVRADVILSTCTATVDHLRGDENASESTDGNVTGSPVVHEEDGDDDAHTIEKNAGGDGTGDEVTDGEVRGPSE